MNIAVNTGNYEILNRLIAICKEKGDTIVNAKFEDALFEQIAEGKIDAYVMTESTYLEKAIDFIKKSSPYTPVIVIGDWTSGIPTVKADIIMPVHQDIDLNYFVNSLRSNIKIYMKNFAVLKKLTTKMADMIEFGNCKYDPTRRLLYVNGKETKKLSLKEGGVLEILAQNYGQIVKKDVIMEKVWYKSDFFTSRSLDVYTTHLRNTLKFANIPMQIKSISKIGLILEADIKPRKRKK